MIVLTTACCYTCKIALVNPINLPVYRYVLCQTSVRRKVMLMTLKYLRV